ncbi:MAG: flagellar motor protein [Bryobacterales bacterium]|nr:flagellar motor protein [Bryobacterales bacterium]
MAAKAGTKPKGDAVSKPDLATIGGLVLAFGGILGGLVLEGGSIKDVSQVTAAMIVIGGTLGAVMVTTPMSVLAGAAKKLPQVFLSREQSAEAAIEELIGYATKARKSGIVSLEQEVMGIPDPFLQKALNLAIDGMELKELRKMMELEIGLEEQRAEEEAKVYEAAGGYSPTIGIIGAVLGLIQVMKHLENIEEVGKGIAVAFVATVYGVGLANIFFLPAGNKLKARTRRTILLRELALEGVAGIVEGLNPKLIRSKLEAYAREEAGKAAGRKQAGKEPQAAPAKS